MQVMDLPRTRHPPLASGVLRQRLEDFVVCEDVAITPEGRGEHLWLRIEKRGLTTDHVAKVLAQAAGRSMRNVGYAGLKDRHAVAEQWFSIHLPRPQSLRWVDTLPAQIIVRQHIWHNRKLKKGALQGNAFDITVRDVYGDREAVTDALCHLREQGFPNYFMEQRWGVDGANLKRAGALFAGELHVRDRFRRGMYLSAARALIFNKVLSARVRDSSWATALPGDALMLDGCHSFFVEERLDAELIARVARGDLHPSGPLWGKGEPPTQPKVRALECDMAKSEPVLSTGLATLGVKHARRALRVVPKDLQFEWQAAQTLRLRFYLPRGSYATACLHELIGRRMTCEHTHVHSSNAAS